MKKHLGVKVVGVVTAIAVFIPAVSAGNLSGLRTLAVEQGNPEKSETVYVNTDAAGSVKSEIVSNWLHDDTASAVINDYSELTDIKNVKGNDKPTINGSKLTWKLSGNDVYYQGKTTKQLPVSVKVQYYLDGKELSPSDLAGKSGKFELKITFKNLDVHSITLNGTSKNIYTPFLCAAAFDLPSKYFSNVTSNFGKVLSDGSNQAVSFVTIPGLKESFSMYDTSTLNIPDTLDVTADVKNFQLSAIMMLVTPVPDMSSLVSTTNFSSLLSKLDDVYNAGLQLKDGANTLSSGEKAFTDGMQELYTNVANAGSSFDQIVSGGSTVASGAAQVAGGTSALLAQLQNGSGGTTTLKDGIDSLYKQILTTGSTDPQSMTLADLIMALSSTSTGAPSYVNTVNSLLTLLRSDTAIYNAVYGELMSTDSGNPGLLVQLQAAMQQAAANHTTYTVTDAQKAAATGKVTELVMLTDTGNATELAKTNGILTSLSAMGFTGLPASVAAAQQQLTAGGASITTGVGALKSQFTYSASSLNFYDGIAALEAQTVKSTTSTPTLFDSVTLLNSGAQQLSSGAATLSSGLGTFKSGLTTMTGGIGTLLDNSGKLSNGANALSSGIGQFWDQGISKLKGTEKDKLSDALLVKDELVKLSSSYTTFTGTGDGIQSSVKFILKTDEISPTATVTAKPVAKAVVKKNVFQKIADWFAKVL